MKVVTFKCDRCDDLLSEGQVIKVEISHTNGRFDLRDEGLDLCAECTRGMVEWLAGKV